MNLIDYIKSVGNQFNTGAATEHSYRGILADYIKGMLGASFTVINEPSRIDCGAPDYMVMKNSSRQPVFYLEAKDIGDSDLDGNNKKGHKEQFDRYKNALDYIVFTDYLDFHFYAHGEWQENIRLGEIHGDKIVACPDAEAHFEEKMKEWSHNKMQQIKNATRLAQIMASKAKMLRIVTENTMNRIGDAPCGYSDSQLHQLFLSFKSMLISDLDNAHFADMYAQTIVYGLFAARLNDSTPQNFSREEAAQLIPKSNPFLRMLFNSIAGNDLDSRVAWIVDDLVETFAATDVSKVMSQYGHNSKRNDPMVHFYEDFLEQYDAKLRKDFGVWYTPKPVVRFIVRSIDQLLKKDFGLKSGLADKSKREVELSVPGTIDKNTPDRLKHEKKLLHTVQILDPATGTATFLAECVLLIHEAVAKKNAGLWQDYVSQDLKPRLNGFEIMVAPYTIAHIKLDMILRETGYKQDDEKRIRVYLSDSLAKPSNEPRTVFNAISAEAEAADKVKREMPIMVVLGNPPYNVSSQNNGTWIKQMISVYKKGLKEKKINLDDDYIKFIRYGERFIEKNQGGILAYINNNSYIDGLTHRQMRYHLLNTFDDIYIINLHGSFKKKETCPDGSKDENVFGIRQGVCINIFVKNQEENSSLAKVHYCDVYGSQEKKLDFLESHDVTNLQFEEVTPEPPYYFFVNKDLSGKDEYDKHMGLLDLFAYYFSGIQTKRDKLTVQFSTQECKEAIDYVANKENNEIMSHFKLQADGRDWRVSWAKDDVAQNRPTIQPYMYRPFDIRYVPYTGKSKGIIGYPRKPMFDALSIENNISLITTRQLSTFDFQHVFASRHISDINSVSSQTKEQSYVFPLYVTKENMGHMETLPNFKEETYRKVCDSLGFEPTPEQLFDYIYAVLHSPKYRMTYNELLKIDFPRIPYPTDKEKFLLFVLKGHELITLHLMDNADNWDTTVGFPITGSNVVETLTYKDGNVHINDNQYFSDVPQSVWDAYIGGYQPAQKWLKDRKGRVLDAEDVLHYEQLVYAIEHTQQIMDEIEKLG